TDSFLFAQKEISTGLEKHVQTLQQRDSLARRKVRQHIQAEDAVEAADEIGLSQIHGGKGDQVSQPWLHQQMVAYPREVGSNPFARKICQRRLGIKTSFCEGQGFPPDVAGHDMNIPAFTPAP